jgi:hypothetical protein
MTSEPTHEQAIDASNTLIDWFLENTNAFCSGEVGQIQDVLNHVRSVAEDCADASRTT